jgi:hypothetical protein
VANQRGQIVMSPEEVDTFLTQQRSSTVATVDDRCWCRNSTISSWLITISARWLAMSVLLSHRSRASR